jgi:hypothetical protein
VNKFPAIALSAAVCALLSAGVSGDTMTAASYKAASQEIVAKHKVSAAACESLSGNAEDICEEESDGNYKILKAELEARNTPSSDTNYEVRVAKADVAYSIAKEKCDDFDGNVYDVCRKEAKSAHVSARADADVMKKTVAANEKAGEKSTDASADARKTTNEARVEAAEDKSDAAFSVAKEKCDALAGDAKDGCVKAAKVRFDRS